ncbi:protein N-lysine methyltransferase METTL21A-like [Glandiceps talaboti]
MTKVTSFIGTLYLVSTIVSCMETPSEFCEDSLCESSKLNNPEVNQHCDRKKKAENQSSEPEPPNSQSMAVVVYNPTHIQPFKLQDRQFRFVGKDISIKQDWGNIGVAAVVWDAAIVLCDYLEKSVKKSKLNLSNQRLIELGAGTGLVGMVAALLGADVIVTDRQMALKQLQENINRNLKPTGDSSEIRINVQELDWGQNLEDYAEPFDIILGADIIYIKETFPDLLKTLIHLSDCKTLVLLSCRIRYEKDSDFIESLKDHFSVTKIFYDAATDVRIYKVIKQCEN